MGVQVNQTLVVSQLTVLSHNLNCIYTRQTNLVSVRGNSLDSLPELSTIESGINFPLACLVDATDHSCV